MQKSEMFELLDSLVLLPPTVRGHVARAYDDAANWSGTQAHLGGLTPEQVHLEVIRAAMYRSVASSLWLTVGGRPVL